MQERYSDNIIAVNAGMVGSQGIVRTQRRHVNEAGGQGRFLGEADSSDAIS